MVKIVIVTSAVISFLWVLFTFSLSYGKDAHANGILGYPITYYMFKDTTGETAALNGGASIPNSIFAVYELVFALVTPAIIASSLGNRINLNGFVLFMFFWHIAIYCPVAHVVWSARGAFYTNGIRDFSGALVVHLLATTTSISSHLVLGKDAVTKSGPVANPDNALFLAFIVWFLWFGFNAGKAHDASAVAAQSIVNTIAGTFTSILTSFLYNLIFEKATTPVSLTYAILIALVALTPASGYVTVGGAMIICLFSYVFTAVVSQFLLGEGVNENEPFSVIAVHGVAGVVGFLWTAIICYDFVNPDSYNGLTYGRGMPLALHIAAILLILSTTFIATFLVAFLSNLILPFGVSAASEEDFKPAAQEEPVKEVETNQV